MREALEQTTNSQMQQISGENFESTAHKRSKKLSMLDSIDQNRQVTSLEEIDSRMNYGYRQVEAEKKPLDHLLDNLDEACVKVLDSHIDRLAWQYKPKLALAQEKVNKLEQVCKQKEKEREEREQLVKLNQQIAHFKMMEEQLTRRKDKLKYKIEKKKQFVDDMSEDNSLVSRQLLDLNKANLKQTYVLEDLQLEHDQLMTQNDTNSMFLTASKSKKSLQTLSKMHEVRQSYASLTKDLPGQYQINQVI